MLETTATELQNKTGSVIERAMREPVRIMRHKRAVAVLLSASEYERMEALEDSYWGESAKTAAQSGSVSQEEINNLLEKLA